MKIFLCFIILLGNQIAKAADEADKISIIIPQTYERKPGMAQDAKASATVWVGDVFNAANVGENVNKTLAPYKKDLASYFPGPGEFDRLVNSLVAEVNSSIVKGDMTDAKLIKVNQFLGNRMVGKIFDRILEKQGVTDPARRKIWTDKLLAPFNTCIGKASNGYYAAGACMTALTKSLVPSAGVGLVYEMSRSKFASSIPASNRAKFNADIVQIYKDCLPKGEVGSTNVMECAVKAMKNGLLKVADIQLTDTINKTASNASNAKSIKANVWPNFNSCVTNVRSNSDDVNGEFMNCLDSLVQNAGMALVKDKLQNTNSIKVQFAKSDFDKLVKDKVDYFKKCTDDLIARNVRKDGMLNVDSCQERITNDVAYKVILSTFDANARDMLKGEKDQIDTVREAGKRSLDACWNNDQGAKERDKCIKTSVIVFSKHIAAFKLDEAIPDNTPKKKELMSSSLESLKSCLEKNLPSNISESTTTDEKIAACTDSLTKNVALTVAESQVRDSLKGKMTPKEIDQVIAASVKKDFAGCLGSKPTDPILDQCSDKLKIAVTDKILDGNINAYLGNRPGIDLSKMRADVKRKLMTGFKECLSTSKNKDDCTDQILKDANRTIVVAFGRTEASVQLNTDHLPSKLDPVEDDFVKCTESKLKGDALAKHLDDCNKKFAIEFARTLGNIKLKYLLEKALGSKTLDEQNKVLDSVLSKYNACLDDLYKYKMEDNLTDKITICTKDLENRALGVVRGTLSDWMSSEEKDSTTIAVKNEFASIVPCLSVLLPASPYDPKMQGNVESILKPVAQLLAQYIDYNPENARMNLNEIINKLKNDLSSTTDTEKAKSDLVDMLYKNGALDQFIKSMVRGKVKDAFTTLSDKDLPKSIRDGLVTRDNFDQIFNGPEGKEIKDFVHQNILKPMLINNADMKSPLVAASLDQVNNKVIKMLINSPKFGDVIVKAGVQTQIDNMGGFTKFFAKVLYGSDNLNWEKVRTSPRGLEAEAYIKEHVLMPKFSGKAISPEEEKKISAEAERLVKEAVKKYES